MVNCSETDPWGNPYTFQCSYGCCGNNDFRYCCSSNGNSYVPAEWEPDIPGYAIAGVTAGCVLAVAVLAGMVYAFCRYNKRKDKFLDQAINRLRVPPSKSTGHVNATTRMYPGPRSGVRLLTTYIPRDQPQLTSTPISSPVVPETSRTRPAKKFGSKGHGSKSKISTKDPAVTNVKLSGNNRKQPTSTKVKPRDSKHTDITDMKRSTTKVIKKHKAKQ